MKKATSPANIDVERYYPIGEAADLIGVTRKTLLKYANSEMSPFELRFDPMNGRKLFSGADLYSYATGTIWARKSRERVTSY